MIEFYLLSLLPVGTRLREFLRILVLDEIHKIPTRGFLDDHYIFFYS